MIVLFNLRVVVVVVFGLPVVPFILVVISSFFLTTSGCFVVVLVALAALLAGFNVPAEGAFFAANPGLPVLLWPVAFLVVEVEGFVVVDSFKIVTVGFVLPSVLLLLVSILMVVFVVGFVVVLLAPGLLVVEADEDWVIFTLVTVGFPVVVVLSAANLMVVLLVFGRLVVVAGGDVTLIVTVGLVPDLFEVWPILIFVVPLPFLSLFVVVIVTLVVGAEVVLAGLLLVDGDSLVVPIFVLNIEGFPVVVVVGLLFLVVSGFG